MGSYLIVCGCFCQKVIIFSQMFKNMNFVTNKLLGSPIDVCTAIGTYKGYVLLVGDVGVMLCNVLWLSKVGIFMSTSTRLKPPFIL
jgi:hypothetical protein